MSHQKKLYKSKKSISDKVYPALLADLNHFLGSHSYIKNKKSKRKIFFDKLPEAIIQRKSSRKRRCACFVPAIEICKNSRLIKNPLDKTQYSICGYDKNSIYIEIHLREEVILKDKKLQFISCFYRQEKKLPPAS